MKKIVSMILSLTLILSMIPQLALAEEPGEYEGKTVVVYTGNLRGDIDKYPKVAAAKKAFLDEDADKVLLVDAGNYMQGTRFANSDRGESIYSLMDASGYDVAAMGSYEFVYGNGGVGNPYHQASYKKFPSQSELAENVGFTVISSNLNGPGTSGNYDFDENKIVKVKGKRIGFVAQTDENTPDMVQDGFMAGCEFGDVSLPKADVVIGLSNNGKAVDGATATISAPTDGEEVIGAYVIDTENKTAEEIKDFNVDSYTQDADVASAVDSVKNSADPKIGDSDVMLNGSDTVNWQNETNLGDLVTDAYKWYAENEFEGFEKDAPVVAIQNGGNCDQFLYNGEVTELDLFNSLPFSPRGMGIIYLTGEELLTALEAGTSPSDRYSSYGDNRCPGFAHVAGLTYNVDFSKEYDKGEAYGNFYKAASINRVSNVKVGDEDLDPAKTYAVIADWNLINGGMDTYYGFKEAKENGAKCIYNGTGIWEKDVVKMYIDRVLNGKIGDNYAEPQGRITQRHLDDEAVANDKIDAAKNAAETAKKAADTAAASKEAADKAAKTPGKAAVDAANKAKADADAAKKAAEAAKKAADDAVKAAEKAGNEEQIKTAGKLQSDAAKAVESAKKAAKAAADKAAAEKAKADKKAKEEAMKKVKTVTVNVKTVNAKALDKAVAKAKGSSKYVTKFVLGKKVKKIAKNSFKEYKAVTVLQIKTKKLKKKAVKGSLKGSNVKKIEVKVGSKKANKKIVKKYKKIFTKKNAGKKVTIK